MRAQARLSHLSQYKTEEENNALSIPRKSVSLSLDLDCPRTQGSPTAHYAHKHLQGFPTAQTPWQNENIAFAIALVLFAACLLP